MKEHEEFSKFLENNSEEVRRWSSWKQSLLGVPHTSKTDCEKERCVMEILVGPIASGKSTYAKIRAKDGAIIVNDDAIVMSLHAGQYKLYRDHLKPLYKSIETHIITSALLAKCDVIIDRPNHKMSTRQKYIQIAKSFDVLSKIVPFPDCGREVHVMRRMKSDPRGLTEAQWGKVYDKHKEESKNW